MKKSMDDIYRDHVLSNANEVELSYLAHHGILGQKWGVRRFQNKDGSLTKLGRKHKQKNSEEVKQNNEKIDIKISTKTKDEFDKMRNSSPTDEEKDKRVSAWEKARDTDMYEMNFLESVQNADIFVNNNKDSMLGEYAKYLTNREDYMENQAYKLK